MELDLTKLKQTPSDLVEPQLWNMHTSKFLHVTGCALDIRVQGRFLKCAHSSLPSPPPPSHFLRTQTKAASLGKELGHLCSCAEAKPARLVVGVSASTAQSTSVQLLPDGTRRSKTTSAKTRGLARPKHSTFPQESARDEALLCSQNPKGSVHHCPPALIWLSGRRSGGFPQVASHCLNKLLVKHVSNARQVSTGDPSSPSKQWGRKEAEQIRGVGTRISL